MDKASRNCGTVDDADIWPKTSLQARGDIKMGLRHGARNIVIVLRNAVLSLDCSPRRLPGSFAQVLKIHRNAVVLYLIPLIVTSLFVIQVITYGL